MSMASFKRYEDKFGPWDAHSIEYAPGQFTFGGAPSAAWLASRGHNYASLMDLFLRKPLSDCRILDIGCFEGGLSYHLATFGADVVGLEIRDEHLGKCEFLREAFPDLRLSFIKGDMLKLSSQQLGQFDAVLLAGTLYHVDAPDIIPFMKSIADLLQGVVVIDTHIAQRTLETYRDPDTGSVMYGRSIIEHSEGDSEEEREKRLRTAFTNNFSFWPTRKSLTNALTASGFRWVLEPHAPSIDWPMQDRVVFVTGNTELLSNRIGGRPLTEPDVRPMEHKMLHNRNHTLRHNPSTKRL